MEVPTPKITEGLSQKKRKIGRNESRNWKGLNQTRNKTKQNNNNNKKQEKQNKKKWKEKTNSDFEGDRDQNKKVILTPQSHLILRILK